MRLVAAAGPKALRATGSCYFGLVGGQGGKLLEGFAQWGPGAQIGRYCWASVCLSHQPSRLEYSLWSPGRGAMILATIARAALGYLPADPPVKR